MLQSAAGLHNRDACGADSELRAWCALSLWVRGFAGGNDWLAEVWDEYASEESGDEPGTGMLVLSYFASRKLAETCRREITYRDMSLEDLAGEMLWGCTTLGVRRIRP